MTMLVLSDYEKVAKLSLPITYIKWYSDLCSAKWHKKLSQNIPIDYIQYHEQYFSINNKYLDN